MERFLPSVIVGAIVVLALAGMYFGWRARAKHQATFVPPDSPPQEPGVVLCAVSALYVATTLAEQPLERVVVQGFGFRSRAAVTVTEKGIALGLTGQNPVFISKEAVRSVARATWTIDKGVEPGGLIVVAWTLGGKELDSYFRLDEEEPAFLAAVDSLTEGAA